MKKRSAVPTVWLPILKRLGNEWSSPYLAVSLTFHTTAAAKIRGLPSSTFFSLVVLLMWMPPMSFFGDLVISLFFFICRSIMDSGAVGEADRASSLAFCRDTITRIADKGLLQRAHIETLLSERVRFLFRLNPKNFATTKFSCIDARINFFLLLTSGFLPALFQTLRSQSHWSSDSRWMDSSPQRKH